MNISRGKGKELIEVHLSCSIISTVKDKSFQSTENFRILFQVIRVLKCLH